MGGVKTVLRNFALDKFRLYATNPEFATAVRAFILRIEAGQYGDTPPLSSVRIDVIRRQLVYDGHEAVATEVSYAAKAKLPIRWVRDEVQVKGSRFGVRLDAWHFEDARPPAVRSIFMIRVRRSGA